MSAPACILGLGLATPEHSCTQAQAATLAIELGALTGNSARLARAIHERSGIARRGSCVLDASTAEGDALRQSFFTHTQTHPHGPGTMERMQAFGTHAARLAHAACSHALHDADIDVGSITHLVVVSCTGFGAPGVDTDLIESLGLRAGVHRLNVGYMGCHGAIIGVRTAAALAAEPGARVLVVCIELCTLHMQHSDRADRIVANALFADGAAACVVGCDSAAGDQSSGRRLPRIRAASSRLIPGTRDAMRWDVTNHGFAMTLAESVPTAIRTHLAAWIEPWLRSVDVPLERARREAAWIVHPGGPRVLDACEAALELPVESLTHARAVLREHGNMSSATVLFILDRVLRTGRTGPMVMLGFGPGLTCEALLCE